MARGRPPGSKDKQPRKPRGANGNGAAVAEAAPGHNSQLSDDERQALHFRHTEEYERALAVKKESDANLKNVAKRIKAEGGSVAAVKISIALKTPEGEAAFKARIQEEIEVAAWNGVGVQMSMFDEVDMTPLVDKARSEGKRAGLKGEPRRSPYQGEAEQAWLDGYHEGQTVLASDSFKKPAEDFSDAMPDREVVA